jgi:hypothetical protein
MFNPAPGAKQPGGAGSPINGFQLQPGTRAAGKM